MVPKGFSFFLVVLSMASIHLQAQQLQQLVEDVAVLEKEPKYNYGSLHQDSFGGIYNIGHPYGANEYQRRRKLGKSSSNHDTINVHIPKSAVPHSIPSIANENIENLHGHYIHDEHQSPFASHLYDRPQKELDEEQKSYIAKMNMVRNKYGAWNFYGLPSSLRRSIQRRLFVRGSRTFQVHFPRRVAQGLSHTADEGVALRWA